MKGRMIKWTQILLKNISDSQNRIKEEKGGCLLTFGCAARQPAVPVMPDCPAPPVPELPALISGEPLDSLANVRILMERDDCMRLYVRGLEDALECYKKTGDNYGPASNGGSFANP